MDIRNTNELYDAIKDMTVRGAPSIGAAAAYGVAQAHALGKEMGKWDAFEEGVDNLRRSGNWQDFLSNRTCQRDGLGVRGIQCIRHPIKGSH